MLGAIIGDMVGSIYEFHNIKTVDFPFLTEASHVTDDSVMTFAVAEGLMNSWGQSADKVKEAVVSSMQSYGRRYPEAGYGRTFYQWIFSDEPKPYHSWGNGSAMRVSSVAWLFEELELVEHIAGMTAEVSHDHREGIKGAKAIAAAICMAKNKESKASIKKYIEDTYRYHLDTSLDEIRPDYEFDVSCKGSVPWAIRAFLEGGSYEEVVRLAISIGGDSDTLAAMAGSIAEAYYGIPEEIKQAGLKLLDTFLLEKYKEFEEFLEVHFG
ncbi:MAG: ADP-ribosylglycohydrolase family protein [Dorea sp.]|nr:ADP-ribosylglycohydrolase family protein [Dorea sp.]